MAENAAFWDSRVEKHGHTGWADPLIYSYDQPARLHAIDQVVESLGGATGRMLDFGAGSGDFSAMLAARFGQVVACDISAEAIDRARRRYATIENIQFQATSDLDALDIADGSLDLVLSVTVLGHITTDEALSDLLRRLRTKLKARGKFVALEYTPESEMPASDYQRFLTPNKWRQVFESCGYFLDNQLGFQHPTERPAGSYLSYRRKWITRLLHRYRKRVMHTDLARRLCRRVAASELRVADDCYWPIRDDDVMRIMVFGRNEDDRAMQPG